MANIEKEVTHDIICTSNFYLAVAIIYYINFYSDFKFSIVVTPRVLDSTEEVRSLLKRERNCKFSDETDDSALFNINSHSGCLFECLWRQAKDECGCIPWKYPQLENESMICDYNGNDCFKKILEEGTRVLNCTCLVDCSKISYDYYIVKEQLKTDVECYEISQYSNLIEYLKKYQVFILFTMVINSFTFSNYFL